MPYNNDSGVVVGIDTGATGKVALIKALSSSPDDRAFVFDVPTLGVYVNPLEFIDVVSSAIDEHRGKQDVVHIYLEKSATGQAVRGVHTAATNFGIMLACCSLIDKAHLNIVHATTWQATMRRFSSVGEWKNKKAKKATKDLPSLIAHAYAPQFSRGVDGFDIDIDDNVADAICIALHGAMELGYIDRIMVNG